MNIFNDYAHLMIAALEKEKSKEKGKERMEIKHKDPIPSKAPKQVHLDEKGS